jgi:hypothetical protein
MLFNTNLQVHSAVRVPSKHQDRRLLEKQKNKRELTKRMEGTECQALELQNKLPSARKVADHIVRNAERTDFAIYDSSNPVCCGRL